MTPQPKNIIRAWILPFFFGLLATAFQHSQAALYDEHPGSDLQVHYVYLTGYRSNPAGNEAGRRVLLDVHEKCVASNQRRGLTYTRLPPEGVPAIVEPRDIEIYYSSNRSLTVTKSKFHHIDYNTCALQVVPHHQMELLSAIGRCTIDVIKQSARGVCDDQAHARAPNTTMSGLLPDIIPAAELSKVPPHLRAEAVSRFERAKGISHVLTGEVKTIAGYRCEVRRTADTEKCVSNPPSPFLIPVSYLNRAIPGLLLETKSPLLTLEAQEVKMSIGVSQSIFMLPKGLKVRSVASPGVHP